MALDEQNLYSAQAEAIGRGHVLWKEVPDLQNGVGGMAKLLNDGAGK